MSHQSFSWKHDEMSQRLFGEIQAAIEEIKKDLTSGQLLFSDGNEKLVREYCYSVGKVDGLKYLEKLLIEIGGEDAIDEPDEGRVA